MHKKQFYNKALFSHSHQLRSQLTKAEVLLWSKLRDECRFGVKFYMQTVIGNYIVDFYAPKIKLIIELDGSQHFDAAQVELDKLRDASLAELGLLVLRYDNRQVLFELNGVLEDIYAAVQDRLFLF